MANLSPQQPSGTAPRFSVAIPVYNCEAYLRAAIESALNQAVPSDSFEVIVVDNCSSDNSYSVAQSYAPAVKAYRNTENIGAARNFNECFARSSGEYIVLLHADDLLDREYMPVVGEILDRHEDVDLVLPKNIHIDSAGQVINKTLGLPRRSGILENALVDLALGRHGMTMTASWTTRRRFYERHGGFDLAMVFGNDLEFGMRAALHSKLYYAPRAIVYYRRHGGSNGVWQSRAGLDIDDGPTLHSRYLAALPCSRLKKSRIVHRGILNNLWTTIRYGLQGDSEAVGIRAGKLLALPYHSIVSKPICGFMIWLCQKRWFASVFGWAFSDGEFIRRIRRFVLRVLLAGGV